MSDDMTLDDLTVVGIDGIRRSFDEHYDTMMCVEQDPTGAHHAILNQHARIEELEAKLATASYNATAFGHRIVALEAKLERISEEWASALYGDLDHGVKSLSEAAHLDFHRRFPSVASFGSTLLDIMLEDNT